MDGLAAVLKELKNIAYLRSAGALLSWDQETYMPEGAGAARAEQIAFLTSLAHEKLVSKEFRSALKELVDLDSGEIIATGLEPRQKRLVREIWRDYFRAAALPSAFVNELAHHASISQQVWTKARKNNDFEAFKPYLAKMVELKKREAKYLNRGEPLYDTLLDEYEPGMTTARLEPLFTRLRERLVPFIERLQDVKHRVNNRVLKNEYDIDKQWNFGMEMLRAIGFDLKRGRQDRSAHPFTTSTHPTDVRITTRLYPDDLKSALLSSLHEGGHGLYEQGLDPEAYGTPFGEATSLGIHESQSRLWENLVGLSKPFWQFAFPKLQQFFPEQLKDLSWEELYRAMNKVQPSFIRVEADEATYNLHIVLRFELEKKLINDELSVAELPNRWDDLMEKYLGIRPRTVAEGVMQDVHWSFGAIGYFPTYTLGNLYSVQFFKQAQAELGDLDDQIAHGHFGALREWLREKIHRVGRAMTAEELVQHVTGQPLSAEPFLAYIEEKYSEIYNL